MSSNNSQNSHERIHLGHFLFLFCIQTKFEMQLFKRRCSGTIKTFYAHIDYGFKYVQLQPTILYKFEMYKICKINIVIFVNVFEPDLPFR